MKIIPSIFSVALLSAFPSVYGQRCEGTATSCGNFFSEGPCEAHSGCSWGGISCSGNEAGCDEFLFENPCESQDGCSWNGGGGFCFSGNTQVFVAGQEGFASMKMKDLQVGDSVWTPQGEAEKVVAFGHRDPTQKAMFVQLHFGASAPLEMTPDHMLFVSSRKDAVRAESVRVGDELIQSSPSDSGSLLKVTKVSTVNRRGVYAPITSKSGTLAANGVAASSYIAIQETDEANSEFAMVKIPFSETRIALPFLSQQYGAHMFLAPLRLFCSYNVCDTPNEHGIHPWVKFAIDFTAWAQEAPFVLQAPTLIGFGAFIAFFAILESVLANLGRFLVTAAGGMVVYALSKKLSVRRAKQL